MTIYIYYSQADVGAPSQVSFTPRADESRIHRGRGGTLTGATHATC